MTNEEIKQNLALLGLTTESPTEHVRATMVAARFTETEIEAAVTFLQPVPTPASAPVSIAPLPVDDGRVLATRKLFRTQQALQPHEIQQLLGVDVAINSRLSERERHGDYFSMLQYVLVWFFSVVIAVSGIMFYMYLNHVGFFHEQVGIARIR